MKISSHFTKTFPTQVAKSIFSTAVLMLACVPMAGRAVVQRAHQRNIACDRACMTKIVRRLLDSMAAHDPYALPLSAVYEATENSHPAALGMMELWRTVTRDPKPDFLAVDTVAGQAFFLTRIDEGGDRSVLYGRIKVVDRKIAQLELFVNRSRGDHGFSFSARNLPANVYRWMHPPLNRVTASRATLEQLSRAAFNASEPLKLKIAADCQFLEVGQQVGNDGLGPKFAKPSWAKAAAGSKHLGCVWPAARPTDLRARTVVIDRKLGIVVDAAIVRGRVYPYPSAVGGAYQHMISAFIPDDMKQAQATQMNWYHIMRREGKGPLVAPFAASGVTMQVLQFYNGRLQGMQINVHLEGPGARSMWPSN